MGLRRLRLPLPPGWALYRGYQWTTVRRECAEHLLDAIGRQRTLMEHFQRTICPDEAVAQLLAGRFHFARKFDSTVDSKVLDLLDQALA